MTRKLILTTTALLALSVGTAFAQQNNSDEQAPPNTPNCTAGTAGCVPQMEDLNTESGGPTGQPAITGQQEEGATGPTRAPQQQQQQENGVSRPGAAPDNTSPDNSNGATP